MTRSAVPLALLLAIFTACGTEPGSPDAGAPLDDAGQKHLDAGEDPVDAGEEPVDAGEEPIDAGEEPFDAGEEPFDAGEEPVDAGEEPVDAGEDPVDAGEEPVDAGEGPADPVDAGEDPVDAGPGYGPELIENGGFEQWGSTLPDAWFGSTSNISSEGVLKDTLFPFEGDNACTLVNTSTTHRRFTTAARHAPAGRYDCTYKVRGHGDIRNAFFDDDYSAYSPYTHISTDDWKEIPYEFNLAEDVHDTFELIFSVRNTSSSHLVIDDVSCRRRPEPCDAVTCEDWQRCRNDTAACETRSGRCADDADCNVWELCNEDHRCEPRPGRCNSTQECAVNSPQTPVCNVGHHCELGDPCAGVTCQAPRTCNPETATCRLEEGVCVTTADCTGALPACDTATNTCVGADHPANIFPNGGFENWNTWYVPYRGDHWLPDAWYGLDGVGDSEIDPENVREYTASVHGGDRALQLIGGQVADRFTSDAFDVPTGTYSCSYRARGKGSLRHRSYSSGGWSVQTPFVEIDSDEWQRIPFTMPGNVRDYRLIFYASRTDAARDHLQIDDVVCTKNAP